MDQLQGRLGAWGFCPSCGSVRIRSPPVSTISVTILVTTTSVATNLQHPKIMQANAKTTHEQSLTCARQTSSIPISPSILFHPGKLYLMIYGVNADHFGDDSPWAHLGCPATTCSSPPSMLLTVGSNKSTKSSSGCTGVPCQGVNLMDPQRP